MDQYLVAAVALVAFALVAAGYFIGSTERKSRKSGDDAKSGPDDVAKRSRRAF
jgi:hypothetical protein